MPVASRRRLRILRYACFACFGLLLFDFFLSRQSTYPNLDTIRDAGSIQGARSVYIASAQWNSGDLLREHWIPNLIQVVNSLKAANISIFVSIYENGSWDSTKSTLQQLRQTLEELDVPNYINIDDVSHEQTIAQNKSMSGWLKTTYGSEMRRIPYLASVRNKALEPMARFGLSGVKYDKLLYINDVVFSVSLLLQGLINCDGAEHECESRHWML